MQDLALLVVIILRRLHRTVSYCFPSRTRDSPYIHRGTQSAYDGVRAMEETPQPERPRASPGRRRMARAAQQFVRTPYLSGAFSVERVARLYDKYEVHIDRDTRGRRLLRIDYGSLLDYMEATVSVLRPFCRFSAARGRRIVVQIGSLPQSRIASPPAPSGRGLATASRSPNLYTGPGVVDVGAISGSSGVKR